MIDASRCFHTKRQFNEIDGRLVCQCQHCKIKGASVKIFPKPFKWLSKAFATSEFFREVERIDKCYYGF